MIERTDTQRALYIGAQLAEHEHPLIAAFDGRPSVSAMSASEPSAESAMSLDSAGHEVLVAGSERTSAPRVEDDLAGSREATSSNGGDRGPSPLPEPVE